MPDSAARPAETGGALGYRSDGLASMLEVFALWGSSEFIANITVAAAPGLDATSMTALTFLGRHGAMRPSALAQKLRVGASNVSKITRRLTESDFVERVADTADGRAGLLELTVKGHRVVTKLVDAGDRMMQEIQGDWDQTDRDQFAGLLTKFHTDAQRFDRAHHHNGETA